MGPCLAGPGLRKLVHPAVSAEGDSTRRELRAALSELPTDTEGSPPRLRPNAFQRRATRQRLATFQRSFPVSHPGEINLCNVPVAGCVCSVLAEAGTVRRGFNTKAFFAGENAGELQQSREARLCLSSRRPATAIAPFHVSSHSLPISLAKLNHTE